MNARKQLDLRLRDVGTGLLACAGLAPRPRGTDAVGHPTLDQRPDALTCLSVRSGFDLLLSELAWPPGTEVLVGAITIPDISRILQEHHLVPVPVDLDPDTLAVDESALAAAITPRTRAVLVTHLFGARIPLDGIVALARRHDLALWEDAAQAYTADSFSGHPDSDVVMFSFGTIKTATALGGGVLLVRDHALREKLATRQATWPVQSRAAYASRLLKFGVYLLLQGARAYRVFWNSIRLTGRDPDQLITAWSRGFAGPDFFFRLRHQPHPALRRLLTHRLATYAPTRVQARAAAGEHVRAALPTLRLVGHDAAHRTHWLFPLRSPDFATLQATLRREGFDATRAPSSLHALPGAPAAENAMAEVLYLPVYAAMGQARLDRLIDLLRTQTAEPPASAQ